MNVNNIFDSPALPLLIELEQQGFTLSLSADELEVAPGSRLTADQQQQLKVYGREVVTLLRCCDPGVVERRDLFRRQIDDTTEAGLVVPILAFKPDVAYVTSICFSCGESNGRPTFGRCWRCSLAWRLALRAPVPANVAAAYDEARIA